MLDVTARDAEHAWSAALPTFPSPVHHAVMAMPKLEYFDEIRTTPRIILSDEIIERNEDFLENNYLF